MADVDFGRRAQDYAEHRPGFPDSFFHRLESYAPLAGARAADLGCGPAIVTLELARRGADVDGIDLSVHQVAAGKARVAAAGLQDRCRLHVARAEGTGLPARSFDWVTAGQCWVWFDQQAALREVHRLLRPGGLLAIAHYCYLPQHSAVVRATEALVLEHNPQWTMAGSDGMYYGYVDGVVHAGFELVEQLCYDQVQPFTHAAWRGRMRTCNGVGSGPLAETGLEAFDDALAELLARDFPDEPLHIPHRVFAVVAREPQTPLDSFPSRRTDA